LRKITFYMEDTYRHKGMRRKLLEILAQKGIQDPKILAAMDNVPRHFFVEKAFEELAYQDQALPLEAEQTISQPYTVAYQTQLLELKPQEKVLEIGTGSGYQACILAVLGAKVFSLERQERLYKKVMELFEHLHIADVRVYFKDGWQGLPEFAPFDKILITAACAEIPSPLLEQLSVGGCLVLPKGDEKQQTMQRIRRLSPDKYQTEQFDSFRFVPLLRGKNYEH
jgi:protein-L-isoaspartate(D-aspartate) O-methyltransferase